MMIGGRQQIARLQSVFYRDQYYLVLRLLFINTAINILLILAIIYFISFLPPRHYYATTVTGQIIPLQPLNTEQI